MKLSSLLGGAPGIHGGFWTDAQGRVLDSTPGSQPGDEDAATVAAVAGGLTSAGDDAGLGPLQLLSVKSSSCTRVTVVRRGALCHVEGEPYLALSDLEKLLESWAPDELATPTENVLPPLRQATLPPLRQPTLPPGADANAPPADRTPCPQNIPLVEHWSALRRAFVRGQLTDAFARLRDAVAAGEGVEAPPCGAEPLEESEREIAMQALVEGAGAVMAGDGIGGSRALARVASPAQKNLSFRWAALHWSTWADLKSGSTRSARTHVKQALAISRDLDTEARAVSTWSAAEVLAQDGDGPRALVWLNDARSRFERLHDGWGIGQTWLANARIMAARKREEEAADAARKAGAANPSWDEPPIFLARLALVREDLAAAEEILRAVQTPNADRLRALMDALQRKIVTPADLSAFLREHDSPPTPPSLLALEQIAKAAPDFVQVREVLAWKLLKAGRYTDAEALFRGLLSRPLTPADRASVMLGLECIVQQPKGTSEKPLAATGKTSQDPSAPAMEHDPLLPALSSPDLAATVNSGAVLSGRLNQFALPDLLEFLRSGRRTGLLVCSSTVGMGVLHLHEGRITGASSPSTPGIGDLLLAAGKISAQALQSMIGAHGANPPQHLLAEALVREVLVDADALKEAVTRQIELTLRELILWNDGNFAFSHNGESKPTTDAFVAVDPQAVLLNVLKEMDEASREESVDETS